MITDFVTYLGFRGQCEEAFNTYARIFGGEIVAMMRNSDVPAGADRPLVPGTEGQIMHARLRVGDRWLMGGDAPPQYAQTPQGFCVSIAVDDPAEAARIFNALAEGGTVQMPIGPTFWADAFGMTIDRFGTPWMVNCEKPRS
jgi:PhnB protein